jgi:hypothetical protein
MLSLAFVLLGVLGVLAVQLNWLDLPINKEAT